jgi:hypothetical protein
LPWTIIGSSIGGGVVVIVIVTVVLVILIRKRNNRKRYGRYVSLNIFTDNQYVQVVSINVRQYRRGNLEMDNPEKLTT